MCDPYLQRHTHQGMGHAVAVALKLDVLVDVNLHRLEDGQLPGLHWQASQGRGVDLGKDTGAAPRLFLKRLVVELHDRPEYPPLMRFGCLPQMGDGAGLMSAVGSSP